MGTAVEPAVADAPVAEALAAEALALADASGEDVCCDRAADANSTTNMALTLNRSNTFFTPSTPFSMRSGAPRRSGHSPTYPFWGIVDGWHGLSQQPLTELMHERPRETVRKAPIDHELKPQKSTKQAQEALFRCRR